MATQKTSRVYAVDGFAVTAMIGWVSLGDRGDMTPVEAAFRLIGQHGADGTYEFPHEDGGTWVIEVNHKLESQPAEDQY